MNAFKKIFRLTFGIYIVFSLLMMAFFASVMADIYTARLQIPRIKQTPVIDGRLDDNAWQICSQLSDFVIWTLDNYVADPVTVFMGYDDDNIYVAFKSYDPQAHSLIADIPDKRLRDTFLWGQHFVRVSIANGDVSLQFMADPKGTVMDWKNNDLAWNGEWLFAASINEEDWTAEFQIPFKELDLDKSPEGEVWNIGLTRRYPKGESSQWDGEISFADQSIALLRFDKWQDPLPGANKIGFEAQNPGKLPVEIQCELELIPFCGKPNFVNQIGQGHSSDMELSLTGKPLHYSYHYTIPANSTLRENLLFDLPSEGSYYATATCKRTKGELLLRNRGFWFTLTPNQEHLQKLKEKLGEASAAMNRQSGTDIVSLQDHGNLLAGQIELLNTEVVKSWGSQHWSELSTKIDVLERKIDQFLHRVRWASTQNRRGEADFGVTTSPSILKLRRDKLFPGMLKDWIKISAARNEYESFQICILPFGQDLNGLTITATDLNNSKGGRIPKEHIEISLVEYNNIDWQAAYVTDYKGWYPDPLLPYKGPLAIDGTEVCRPFWITVYVPSDIEAGDYTGSITVSSAGLKAVPVDVSLHVWDFDLPLESHLKTHTWDNLNYLAGFYNLKEYPLDWYLRFCDLLLKNRVNPGFAGVNYLDQDPSVSGEYDFSKVEKVLDFCLKRGLSRFSIVQMKKGPYAPEEAEKIYSFIAAYAKFLREKGWLDKALVELWDEPTQLEWPSVKARAERIRKIDPELRLQLFAEGGPYSFWEKKSEKYDLWDLVDIWAPTRIIESPETQARGDEIWTYFCTLARGIAPNFYIDRPAIYQRVIAWYCWMYGVDGFEHWNTTYFWRNVRKGKDMSEKWPNAAWDSRTYHDYNGEGQLVYPGPNGQPLPSIRLEIFRDSMEDYEYLYHLRHLLKQTCNIAKNSEVKAARQLLNIEDYLLKKYPWDLKATLENTIRFPDQPLKIIKMRNQIASYIEILQEVVIYTK